MTDVHFRDQFAAIWNTKQLNGNLHGDCKGLGKGINTKKKKNSLSIYWEGRGPN